MNKIPFQLIHWEDIAETEHAGDSSTSFWQTKQFDGLRIRKVDYAPGYLADHWCQKGHIVHCLSGSFITELQSGDNYILTEGMSYVVSDELSFHRSYSETEVKLLIIDGDFFKIIYPGTFKRNMSHAKT